MATIFNTTLTELKELIDMNTISDVEYYRPKFQYDSMMSGNFHTDYINSYENIGKDENILVAKTMDEEQYNNSVLVNCGIKADFEEWYGDKNATVLCVLAEKERIE